MGAPRLGWSVILLTVLAAAPMASADPGAARVGLTRNRSKALERRFARPITKREQVGRTRNGYGPPLKRVLLTLSDGTRWVFRGDHDRKNGEDANLSGSVPGTAKHERGLYITSRALRLNVVKKTIHAELDGEAGTVQRWFDKADPKSTARIDWDSVHSVAVLQYVVRFVDDARNVESELVGPEGKERRVFRTFDAEHSFGTMEPERGFMNVVLDGPPQLSPRVWRKIKQTNIESWRQALLSEGIPHDRVDGAVHRLRLVQEHGLDALFLFPEGRAPDHDGLQKLKAPGRWPASP